MATGSGEVGLGDSITDRPPVTREPEWLVPPEAGNCACEPTFEEAVDEGAAEATMESRETL